MPKDNMLEVEKIHTYYEEAHILQGVFLSVGEGESVGVIGRNGAGKTTTLRSIMSINPPRKGNIIFKGEDITGLSPTDISKRGISLTPEERRIFPALNVMEHLRVPTPKSGNGREKMLELVFDIFPTLKERKKQDATSLSGGEQQMLTIARSLITDPDLLLLDEPFEGLAPKIVEKVMNSIKKIRQKGVSILLSSQNLNRALKLANRFYIVEKGKTVWEGPKEELKGNSQLKSRYLGI